MIGDKDVSIVSLKSVMFMSSLVTLVSTLSTLVSTHPCVAVRAVAPVVPVVAWVAAIDGDQARVQEVLLLAGQHGGTCHASTLVTPLSRVTLWSLSSLGGGLAGTDRTMTLVYTLQQQVAGRVRPRPVHTGR